MVVTRQTPERGGLAGASAGALPRTPPRGAAPWNPAKGIALGTIHFGRVPEEGLP
jgi:hypothetical protein